MKASAWMKGCFRLETRPFINRGTLEEAGPPGQHFVTYDENWNYNSTEFHTTNSNCEKSKYMRVKV